MQKRVSSTFEVCLNHFYIFLHNIMLKDGIGQGGGYTMVGLISSPCHSASPSILVDCPIEKLNKELLRSLCT